MPLNKHGVMIILSSPSGAGKTTLVKMLSQIDNFEISVSHTTRFPRADENSGKDYFFVDVNEFERLIKNQEFLEYAKVFNNYYGTTRTPVIDKLNNFMIQTKVQPYADFETSKIAGEQMDQGIKLFAEMINANFN